MYKIDHVGVVVTNMERSVKFYEDVLGCKVKDEYKGQGMHLMYMDCFGETIELVYRAADIVPARDGECGRVDHIAFIVSDINKEVAALKEKNVKFLFDAPFEMDNQWIFFFAGPDGERLEFVQLKK